MNRATKSIALLIAFQGALTSALVHIIQLKGKHQSLALSYGELLMKTQAELMQEAADLKQAIKDDSAADQAVVTKLDGVVATLKARVTELEGAGIDTDALFAALEDAKSSITGATSTTDAGGETDVPIGG